MKRWIQRVCALILALLLLPVWFPARAEEPEPEPTETVAEQPPEEEPETEPTEAPTEAPEPTQPEPTQPEPTQPEPTAPEPAEPEPEEPVVRELPKRAPQPERQVPVFYQNDYPDILYGSGTVANNGCSVTCLAMVATAMTGHSYTPDELADYFGGRAESNMERLEIGSRTLGLAFRKARNADEVWPALEEGKYAILLMNKKSMFTGSMHFILVTGMTADGRFLVNDPNHNNYSNPQLATGLREGFTKKDLLLGYSGAWVYDPFAMPDEPEIYSEPRLDRTRSNYPGVTLSRSDWELMARLIWAEARGECAEGQQAVAEVVLNRLVSDRFPNTVRGVILAEGQFRPVENGKIDEAEPWQAQYQAIDRALYGEPVLDQQVFFYAREAPNDNVFGAVGNHVFCY